jgi:flagellar protein FlaG
MGIQQISGSGGAPYVPPNSSSDGSPSQGSVEVLASAAAPVAAAPVHAVQQAAATPSHEEVKQSVEKINNTIQTMSRNLQFSVDGDTKMKVVKVIDTSTKQVIRQIPTEEVLAIAKTLDKLQGLLLSEKA